MMSFLEDLDFADDLALLSSKINHMQDKTDKLCSFGSQFGLSVNAKETEVLKINNTHQESIKLGNNLEELRNLHILEVLSAKMKLRPRTSNQD